MPDEINLGFDIVLCGGGTGGSVTPLLGVAARLRERRPDLHFLFLGTKVGPEHALLAGTNISFRAVPHGKFRRYFSLRNVSDVFRIVQSFFVALWIVWRSRAKVIMTAGSHVAVPVAWAGWVLGVPVFVHQQDIVPGLANRLMAPIAYRITTTFKEELGMFSPRKTVHTGNPIRADLFSGEKERGLRRFHLSNTKPLIVCLGGGTGARELNEILYSALPELLSEGNLIHSTGVGKGRPIKASAGYIQVPFLGFEYPDVLAAADVVISRAGLATLTELAVLGKRVIVCPLPQTHQEANAEYFAQHGAARIVPQAPMARDALIAAVKEFLHNQTTAQEYQTKIRGLAVRDASEHIAQLVIDALENQ